MRRVLQERACFSRDVVDVLLLGRHRCNIFLQRVQFARFPVHRFVHQKILQLLPVGIIAVRALFDLTAELLIEVRVFFPFVLKHFGQFAQNPLGQSLVDPGDLRIVLKGLPRDVQRKIGGIHNAADKTEIFGNQSLAVVRDKHAADVEMQVARLRSGHLKSPRLVFREKQKRFEFGGAFRTVIDPDKRFAHVAGKMLVEGFVFLRFDFGFRTQPDRLLRIECTIFGGLLAVLVLAGLQHLDRVFDEVGVFLDDGGDAPLFQILLVLLLQMKGDGGALGGPVGGAEREFLFAVGFPADRLFASRLQSVDNHLVGHHERRIESHSELTDQFRIRLCLAFLFALRQILQKRLGSGMRNGSEVLNDLLPCHADSIIGNAECARIRIGSDPDLPRLCHFRLGQRKKTGLVNGVRRIGNQFPKKNFLVGIDRVNHHVQKFTNFCLKTQIFHILNLLVC